MKRMLVTSFVAAMLAFAGMVTANAQTASQPTQYDLAYTRAMEAIQKNWLTGQVNVDWNQIKTSPTSLHNQAELDAALRQAIQRYFPSSGVQLLSQEQADAWKAKVAGGYVGFGVELKSGPIYGDQGVVITKVEDGSTAEDAPLRVGDRIVAVAGKSVEGMTEHDLKDALSGHDGDKHLLTIVHEGVQKDVTIEHDLDGSLGMEYAAVKGVNFPSFDSVRDNTPAQAAGLEEGDLIVSINGQSARDMSVDKAHTAMSGLVGDKLEVVVSRHGKTVTANLTRGIVPKWDMVFADVRQGGDGWSMRQFTHIKIMNFDWNGGITQEVADEMLSLKEYGGSTGMIIDLRGTKGTNVEGAARFAARFIDSGSVLNVYEAPGNTIRYSVEQGVLYKETINAKQEITKDAIGPVEHFNGQVGILVDGDTDGVAVAIAQVLQATGRGVIVGTTTAGTGLVKAMIEVPSVDGHTMAIVMPHSSMWAWGMRAFAPVTPNFWSATDTARDAVRALEGNNLWFTESRLPWIILGVGLPLTFLIAWLFGAFKSAPKSVEEKPAPKEKVTLWGGVWPLLMVAGMLAFIFVGLPMVSRFIDGPPIGGRTEVLVSLYSDGSPASQREEKVINSLKSEYKGDIRFEVVDMKQHPELWQTKDGEYKRFAVSNVPFVWVLVVNYDRNGKEVNRGGSGSPSVYSLTKREIIRSINWASGGPNNTPKIPVTRTIQNGN